MKKKNEALSPEEISFWQNPLAKLKKFLKVLFALGIDKHLDYDQEEKNSEKSKEKIMR
ncbi:MAG: hypothetical protein PVI11_04245 [Candidatus Aminicenantes bacterium]|jgi:hypothetical protein